MPREMHHAMLQGIREMPETLAMLEIVETNGTSETTLEINETTGTDHDGMVGNAVMIDPDETRGMIGDVTTETDIPTESRIVRTGMIKAGPAGTARKAETGGTIKTGESPENRETRGKTGLLLDGIRPPVQSKRIDLAL